MRTRFLVLAISVTALVGCGGERERVVGSVTVLGDSLNVGIEPYLPDELDGWDIANHNLVGRRAQEGVDALEDLGGAVAPVLVVSLGTNDVDGDTVAFRQRIDEVMKLAGPRRCVVWATIWLDGPNESYNAVLRAAARRHEKLELVDWAALVEDAPELLAADGVHGSPEGYARRAQETAAVARRCLPPVAPPS